MVKIRFVLILFLSIIVIGLLFNSCGRNVYISKKVFKDYKKAIEVNKNTNVKLRYDGVYYRTYKTLNLATYKDYCVYPIYRFYYENGLTTGIILPTTIFLSDSIKIKLENETDLINFIKNDSTGWWSRIDNWSHYKIKDSLLEFTSSSMPLDILLFTNYTEDTQFHYSKILNDSTICPSDKKSKYFITTLGITMRDLAPYRIKDSSIYYFKPFPYRPDGYNNDYINMYKKYIENPKDKSSRFLYKRKYLIGGYR